MVRVNYFKPASVFGLEIMNPGLLQVPQKQNRLVLEYSPGVLWTGVRIELQSLTNIRFRCRCSQKSGEPRPLNRQRNRALRVAIRRVFYIACPVAANRLGMSCR